MSSVKDAAHIPSALKTHPEVITPHRLSVGILIMEYFKIRGDSAVYASERRLFFRDISLTILRLIQNPDLTFNELLPLIDNMQDSLEKRQILAAFHETIHSIRCGVGALQDVVDAIGQLMVNENPLSILKLTSIARNSVVGCYLRRLVVNFDKFSFSEITLFFEAYQAYRNSDEKVEITKHRLDAREWSQRQAEHFIATQSALIAYNENAAYSPKQLNQYIRSVLLSNPDLSAAHFINYLNYMRVKDYCGAIESLHIAFDKSANNQRGNVEERTKTYRYAALNLAILYCQFGHKSQALETLKDSIKMAQMANDNFCLQHALSWLQCLTNNQQQLMAEYSVLKCMDLNLSYITSLGLQSYVKQCGLSAGNPLLIFDSLTRSDSINSQNSHVDLIATNYGLKAALWLFYGKSEMCSLWSQLLLHLNADSLLINKSYYGESHVQALCNIAGLLHVDGEYALSHCILVDAEEKFKQEPHVKSTILSRNLFEFQRLLYNEKSSAAASSAAKIAIVDKWLSYLCLAQLHLHLGDFSEAHTFVNRILDECRDGKDVVRIDVQVRAMLMLAEVQIASHFPNASVPGLMGLLNASLAYADQFHLHYLSALAKLYISHVLLLAKMPQQAKRMLERCIVPILSDGGCYDRGRVQTMYALCSVACANKKTKREIILDVLPQLASARDCFERVEAAFRVKALLLLQMRLCHEVDLTTQRNQFALEYRNLLAEHESIYIAPLFRLI